MAEGMILFQEPRDSKRREEQFKDSAEKQSSSYAGVAQSLRRCYAGQCRGIGRLQKSCKGSCRANIRLWDPSTVDAVTSGAM